jgi:Family of unknown function (DUF6165)
MQIEVSIGEVVDKYTILTIKSSKIQDPAKLENVNKELTYLIGVLKKEDPLMTDYALTKALLEINKELWKVEDDLRDLERAKDFGKEFVTLARNVYKLNDKRADIKKQINMKHGSDFVEEKSYQPY